MGPPRLLLLLLCLHGHVHCASVSMTTTDTPTVTTSKTRWRTASKSQTSSVTPTITPSPASLSASPTITSTSSVSPTQSLSESSSPMGTGSTTATDTSTASPTSTTSGTTTVTGTITVSVSPTISASRAAVPAGSGLTGPVIAGIAVGATAALVIVCVVTGCMVRRWMRTVTDGGTVRAKSLRRGESEEGRALNADGEGPDDNGDGATVARSACTSRHGDGFDDGQVTVVSQAASVKGKGRMGRHGSGRSQSRKSASGGKSKMMGRSHGYTSPQPRGNASVRSLQQHASSASEHEHSHRHSVVCQQCQHVGHSRHHSHHTPGGPASVLVNGVTVNADSYGRREGSRYQDPDDTHSQRHHHRRHHHSRRQNSSPSHGGGYGQFSSQGVFSPEAMGHPQRSKSMSHLAAILNGGRSSPSTTHVTVMVEDPVTGEPVSGNLKLKVSAKRLRRLLSKDGGEASVVGDKAAPEPQHIHYHIGSGAPVTSPGGVGDFASLPIELRAMLQQQAAAPVSPPQLQQQAQPPPLVQPQPQYGDAKGLQTYSSTRFEPMFVQPRPVAPPQPQPQLLLQVAQPPAQQQPQPQPPVTMAYPQQGPMTVPLQMAPQPQWQPVPAVYAPPEPQYVEYFEPEEEESEYVYVNAPSPPPHRRVMKLGTGRLHSGVAQEAHLVKLPAAGPPAGTLRRVRRAKSSHMLRRGGTAHWHTPDENPQYGVASRVPAEVIGQQYLTTAPVLRRRLQPPYPTGGYYEV